MLRIKSLTNGEKLFIQRRRRDESQADAAHRYGVSRYEYRRWETGEKGAPSVRIGRIQKHEACTILRRRHGLSLDEVSQEMGVSRWWLCQMERGYVSAKRLIKFWEDCALACP